MPDEEVPMKLTERRQLTLSKSGHEYRFNYAPGEERQVLSALNEMVDAPDTDTPQPALDWFDAAVLSHQLGRHLSDEIDALLPEKEAA